MAKPEWGTKRACPKCSANFYDLKKNPASCPICGHSFDPETIVKRRTRRKGSETASAAKAKIAAAKAKKKKDMPGEDEEAIGLPEFEDLAIMEDMDELVELPEVAVIKVKTPEEETADDDEVFLEDDTIEEDVSDEVEMDEDEEEKPSRQQSAPKAKSPKGKVAAPVKENPKKPAAKAKPVVKAKPGAKAKAKAVVKPKKKGR